MDDLVQAILTNSQAMLSSSQALAEALGADRARREAADRIQRESWEAALKEKDAEIERLRAEAAEAKKKLQADASRKMRWDAAHELLLGANQKLADLRYDDMEDSRTWAETPNSKEVESCQATVDHTASDFRKLKQAYETLSSKKDKEVSALLSEKNSLHSQLDIMQQDYAELLKNKKVETAQATEAALKLQQSVDEHNALAEKKDDEIGRLRAEAVGAKKKGNKELSALPLEKDSLGNQLSILPQNYTKLPKTKKVLTKKKDHEIIILRAEIVGAKRKAHQMHSLLKEKDDEIQRLKGWHVESAQKHYKDISEAHKKSRSVYPAVNARDELRNSNLRKTLKEDFISETKAGEKDVLEKTTHKRRRSSSMSNDCEMSGSNEDAGEQSRSDKDGEQSRSGGGDDDDGPSRTDEHDQSGRDKEITNNPTIRKPPGNHKRKTNACNAETANGKSHGGSNRSAKMSDIVKGVFYHGFGNVRRNEMGVDLSEFLFNEVDMSDPQRWTVEQLNEWLTACLQLNPEVYTVGVHALWTNSTSNISWYLRPVDWTSKWVNWLKECKKRGNRPIALVLPVVKKVTSAWWV